MPTLSISIAIMALKSVSNMAHVKTNDIE